MILYTVYRTTNKINGMFYIGVHKTAKPNDDYLGSGKRLKRVIKKYGVEAFEKEILYVFETREEAYAKEKELVSQKVLDSGKCYNLKLGGEGGWDFLNKSDTKNKCKIGKPLSVDHKNKIKIANTGKHHTNETKQKIKETISRPELKELFQNLGRNAGKSLAGKKKTKKHAMNIGVSCSGIKRKSNQDIFEALSKTGFILEEAAKLLGWKSSGGNNRYRMKRIMEDRLAGAKQGPYKTL